MTLFLFFFFFNDTATTEIYTLSLHDALPISSSNELATCGEQEIRILISTDVLSEGLNLQDATRMINYDLHWNPVRLMQRIGRVDRRMNPQIEEQIVAEHPDQQTLRGKVAFWNFLPPDELEMLLRLYGRVSHK